MTYQQKWGYFSDKQHRHKYAGAFTDEMNRKIALSSIPLRAVVLPEGIELVEYGDQVIWPVLNDKMETTSFAAYLTCQLDPNPEKVYSYGIHVPNLDVDWESIVRKAIPEFQKELAAVRG